MPPKAKPAQASHVYVVVSAAGINSVHATLESANERKAEEGAGTKVEVQALQGGSIQGNEKKSAAKSKSDPKSNPKPAKNDENEPPKASKPKPKPAKNDENEPPKASKTKPPAANAAKGKKSADEELPENVQTLLAGTGVQLSGMIIVVTGVPPTLGRKNAEKLVQAYGGKLGSSITGKTNLVVLGNDAGAKKLELIEKHATETKDEDGFIEFLESGGRKRGADDDGDEEDEDEKPVKVKKQKK
ncbi:Replication factor C subunit [Lachnellula occidentalis]|uniref:Replication factor C subunit n=1 Tax=Lachnellula occidentalis TaxID=215460 RepID=A0A8H8RHZ8_9HELO|nr:Replication factor C subunit [Lachnellula occidentalis]